MNADQKQSLDELKKFIDFVYNELENLRAKHYYKRRKTVLLPMYVNACDLAESVHILLSKERVNASQNLLRGLHETLINAKFIFIDKNYRWVDSYLLESEQDMKKFVNGARHLRSKYPTADTSEKTISEEKLQKLEKRAKKFNGYVKSKYSTRAIPDVGTNDISRKPYTIRDKTIIIDHVAAEELKPKDLIYSYEWQYLMVYKYFSGGAHISASYLVTNLIQKDRTGITILKHGNKSNIQLCAWTAFAFLFDTTTIFAKQFGQPTLKSLKPYQKILNELRDKLPE